MNDLFTGKLVRLSAFDPQQLGKSYSVWARDSELTRLLDGQASQLYSSRERAVFFEEMLKAEAPMGYFFSICKIDDNRLLGDINLDVIHNWVSRDAFVGLGIADRQDWGKGYGTDAMRIILRFAFMELNLRRVTLTVFEYNPRAIRSYEKAGFQHEGRLRCALLRDGKRWDMVYMGILRDEWEEGPYHG